MKKFFTIVLLLSGILKTASAQAPNWMWAKSSNGGNYEYGYGLSVDNAGHLFLSGRITGNVTFGGLTANAPALNPFEEEFDTAGNGIWFQTQFYSYGNDYPGGFFKDDKNNTYGTGIIASSTGGMYVEKRNSSGAMVSPWPVIFTGAAPGGFGVVADKQSNVYFVAVDNPGTVTLNNSISINNPASSGNGTFIAKLDSNGKAIWANSINDLSGNVIQRDITTDDKGNIYTLGEYVGSPVFGTITAPTSSGFSNFFIAKFDTSGKALWVATASSASTGALGAPEGSAHSIVVDSCGNLYVTGKIEGTATFGGISVNSAGGSDMFVAKCDKNGNWQWVNTAGSSSNDLGYSVALDKFNEVYVGGNAGGNINFGNGVSLSGGSELFVAKYSNSTGQALWAQGGGSGANLEGIDVDNQGYIYVVGDYGGTVTFGSTNFTATSASNIFIAKLDTVPPRTIVPQVGSNYCPGSSATISYSVNGTFNAGNTFYAELSDSSGSFLTYDTIGSNSSTGGGVINITIPLSTPSGSNYLIRVVSNNPGTSSYVNGCGAYYANNVYVNTTPVTIGGGSLTPKVSNDTTVCPGAAVQLHASGGTTYSWSPGGLVNDSTSANPYIAPLVSQTYTVTVSSGSCGSATVQVAVTVNPAAIVSVSPDSTTVCSGTSVNLQASGATSYTWTPATGLDCATCASPTATPTVSITYTVTGNGGTCSKPAIVKVTIGNTAIGGLVSAVRDTICLNTPGNLSIAGNSAGGLQWQSSTDSIHYSNDLNDTLSSYKTSPLQQTTWYHVIVGKGNCSAISDSLKLYVPPALTASFNATQTSATTLTFDSDSSSGSIRSYHWDFGDGQTSNDSNPSHTYAKDSTYYVCLTLYDGSNCSYTFCRYSLVTGVPTISAAGNWVIYPNPFNDQLTLSSKQGAGNSKIQSVELYDVLGRVVINKELDNTTNTSLQLDVSSLAKGMYFVMFRTANADYVQKVVKQ